MRFHYEVVVGFLLPDLGVHYTTKVACNTLAKAVDLIPKGKISEAHEIRLTDETGLVIYDWQYLGTVPEVIERAPNMMTFPICDIEVSGEHYPLDTPVLLIHEGECFVGGSTRYRLQEAS